MRAGPRGRAAGGSSRSGLAPPVLLCSPFANVPLLCVHALSAVSPCPLHLTPAGVPAGKEHVMPTVPRIYVHDDTEEVGPAGGQLDSGHGLRDCLSGHVFEGVFWCHSAPPAALISVLPGAGRCDAGPPGVPTAPARAHGQVCSLPFAGKFHMPLPRGLGGPLLYCHWAGGLHALGV